MSLTSALLEVRLADSTAPLSSTKAGVSGIRYSNRVVRVVVLILEVIL